MEKSETPNLRHQTEVRLQRRLADWSDELERLAVENATQPDLQAQGRGIAALIAALERHASQVLADLEALLLESADPTAEVDWLRTQYDAHVEQSITRALTLVPPGQRSSSASFRNRLANLAAAAKAQARTALAASAARAATGERRRSHAPDGREPLDELDDRLPLRRRRVFDRDLATLSRAALDGQTPLALVMIDLDRFKHVNDTHGHPVGDEVLLAVAQLIVKRTTRKGQAYRYGGEEIALLLPDYSIEEATGLAERIRKDIRAAPLSSRGLTITASIGVACLPDQAGDDKSLLAASDAALYCAKHAGRDCVRAFEPEPEPRG